MHKKYNKDFLIFPQVGGFLDVLAAPRRRSWRSEEERRGKEDDEETEEGGKDQLGETNNGRLYVNLPERSNSYDYGRGGSSQNTKLEIRVSSCPETTPL